MGRHGVIIEGHLNVCLFDSVVSVIHTSVNRTLDMQ